MNTQVMERPASMALPYAPSTATVTGRRRALLAIGAGALAMMVTVIGVARGVGGNTAHRPASEVSGAGVTPAFPEVGVADNTYQPGHTSGWHIHPGVHSAVVLAGTLTVYDADCARHDYRPGETYLGGRDPHLARNETSEPVQLVVTFVFAKTSELDHATVVAPPAGCDVR